MIREWNKATVLRRELSTVNLVGLNLETVLVPKTVSAPKDLKNVSGLVGKTFTSRDNTVKLDVAESINRILYRGQRALPHVTDETRNNIPGMKLFSVRFHHGAAQDESVVSVKQTIAAVDVGKSLIRIRGIVLFHCEGTTECAAFAILASSQEAKRVLVNEETWFAKPDSIQMGKWAPLLEGQED